MGLSDAYAVVCSSILCKDPLLPSSLSFCCLLLNQATITTSGSSQQELVSKKVIGVGELKGWLYFLQGNQIVHANEVSSAVNMDIMHRHLAITHYAKMQSLFPCFGSNKFTTP